MAAAVVPAGDPYASHPAYAALNMPAAWDLTTGSPEVVIAVVDSGVDATHPDLAGAVLPGYDFVENTASGTPVDGHGTGVAGAAAARANNGIGGVGTCFRCSILPLRVIGRDGIAFNTTTARAIDYAVDHGAAVVNASIYGPNFSEPLRRPIQRARAAGVLVVAAAGNEGDSDARSIRPRFRRRSRSARRRMQESARPSRATARGSDSRRPSARRSASSEARRESGA